MEVSSEGNTIASCCGGDVFSGGGDCAVGSVRVTMGDGLFAYTRGVSGSLFGFGGGVFSGGGDCALWSVLAGGGTLGGDGGNDVVCFGVVVL